MSDELNTHDLRIGFGKHNGERITRLPVSYLKWAVAGGVPRPIETPDGDVPFFRVAAAEIKRRGERIEKMDVSAHAIDKISLRHRRKWKEDHKEDEGIYSWTQRKALEAWEQRTVADQRDDGTWEIKHFDIKWVIEELAIPVVKTVK